MITDRPLDLVDPPVSTFSLAKDILSELRSEPAYERGKNSRAIVRSQDRELSIVVSVLAEGGELKQHQAPSPTTIIVLEGAIVFSTHSETGEVISEKTLGVHDIAVFTPEVHHSVRAAKESAMLIVMGGR